MRSERIKSLIADIGAQALRGLRYRHPVLDHGFRHVVTRDESRGVWPVVSLGYDEPGVVMIVLLV